MAMGWEFVRSNLVKRNHSVSELEGIECRTLFSQITGELELGSRQERMRQPREQHQQEATATPGQ